MSDLLTYRDCERCGYQLWPGDEHDEMVQPEGSNVVVCKLREVEMMNVRGRCASCHVAAHKVVRVDTGATVDVRHDGAHNGTHAAVVEAAPLVDVLSDFFARPRVGSQDREGL